jgi:hypothetical protein
MFRHGLTVAALVACASSYAIAAERATFILTDGARKSGTLTSHFAGRENMFEGKINLGMDDGTELRLPFEQVAVIDFAGGRPSAAELDAVPNDRDNHLLVLRGGYSQLGRLVNIIGGDTVRWRNAAGQEQQYAVRDVLRVYLNGETARTVFNYTGSRRNAGQAANPVTIQVDARQPWSDSGLTVRQGEQLSFRAAGQIQYAANRRDTTGPNGNAASRRAEFPASGAPVGALIGKIDQGGAPFVIGSQAQPIAMPASGHLYIGVNDSNFGDNNGAYSVTITPLGTSGELSQSGAVPRQGGSTAQPRRAR